MNYITNYYKNKCEKLNLQKQSLLEEKKLLNEYWAILPTVWNAARAIGRGAGMLLGLDSHPVVAAQTGAAFQNHENDFFDSSINVDEYGNKYPPYPAPEGKRWMLIPYPFDPSRSFWHLVPAANTNNNNNNNNSDLPAGGTPSMYDLYFQDTNEPRTFGSTKA